MKKLTRALPILLLPALVLVASAARDHDDDCHDAIELDEAKVFIEFNSTDEDFGIHFFWDGVAWDKMKVDGPLGRTVLRVKASRNLAAQGLTEGFFESDEPSVADLSMEEFLERFPEGTYEFEGRTLDHRELEGETEFTHTLPAPPANLYPGGGAEVDSMSPLVASFDAVTEDLFGDPLVPEQYEVVLETENEILRVFSIILEGDVEHPSVTVPPEFLEPDLEYKLEVIVQEEGGNRTIAETEFTTF